jgi:hypothetical protein
MNIPLIKPPIFLLQYLEDAPEVATLSAADVGAKLRAACDRLPISHVLLGWNTPPRLLQLCRAEAERVGARLFRWHPLLTSDGSFAPRAEWQTIGLQGEPAPGFQGLPEFTFVCPNRPAVQEAILTHVGHLAATGLYDGFFLDRIRFPSPAAHPGRWLACFCGDCRRVAAADGLDLAAIQPVLRQYLADADHAPRVIATLFGAAKRSEDEPALAALEAMLIFRTHSITRFVHEVAAELRHHHLGVGLDCFSPSLCNLVGQALGDLDRCADWSKVMSYGHTLGPAGLPFELLGLADWLVDGCRMSEPAALSLLGAATGLPLPPTRAALRTQGLPPAALSHEMRRGRAAGVKTLLAGIELVELAGVAQLSQAQILADLQTLRTSDMAGLVISWDLWHIPLERLAWVAAVMLDR